MSKPKHPFPEIFLPPGESGRMARPATTDTTDTDNPELFDQTIPRHKPHGAFPVIPGMPRAEVGQLPAVQDEDEQPATTPDRLRWFHYLFIACATYGLTVTALFLRR